MDAPTSNFVTTIPLRTTPQDEATLAKRFDAACAAYNALLGELRRRARLMRESKAWRAARKLPKGAAKSKAYRDLATTHGFREYDFYAFIQAMRAGLTFRPAESKADTNARVKGRVGYVGTHLDAHTVMALAKRAFRAVQRAIFERADTRFKRRAEWRSVEGINAHSAIGWTGSAVKWCGLVLPAVIDRDDPVILHGVESNVRLTRVVRMTIRGRVRFFAQLTSAGTAYRKARHTPGVGVVGLDIGPSTIAVVGETSATLTRFADELGDVEAEVRRLQRRADRQVRAGNPECFDERGRWKKGVRATNTSKALRRTRRKVAELRRRQQAHRKGLHGAAVHRVLKMGNDVRTEKLSYKALQRRFGRSVGLRGPGAFMARLRSTAAKHGATVTEFGTYATRLSQTCLCGKIKKKTLSERTHRCDCGVTAQRDLLSAYLARWVADDRLDVGQAREGWPAQRNVLDTASEAYQRGDGRASCRDPGAIRRAASCPGVRRKPVSAADAVPAPWAERAAEKPVEAHVTREGGSRWCGRQALLWPDLS